MLTCALIFQVQVKDYMICGYRQNFNWNYDIM